MVMMLAAISSSPLQIGFSKISRQYCKTEPDNDVEVQVARDETAGVESEAVVDKAVGEEEVVPAHHYHQYIIYYHEFDIYHIVCWCLIVPAHNTSSRVNQLDF